MRLKWSASSISTWPPDVRALSTDDKNNRATKAT
jgi:hypothetical protein